YRVLKDICGGFNNYNFYLSQKVILINDVSTNLNCYESYYNILAKQINHQDAELFLANKRKQFGSSKATKKLINYRDYQFIPYVLQEQFKSDLVTPKRVKRFHNLYRELDKSIEQADVYLNLLDRKGYVLRALFSSLLFLKRLPKVKNDIYSVALERLNSEIESSSIHPKTEGEIIKSMTKLIKEVSLRYHAGESINTLAIFIYCFRFNEESTQPKAQAAAELLFWDSFENKYDEQRYEYVLIAAFNDFITLYANNDRYLLCNPFFKLEYALGQFFDSKGLNDIAKVISQVFRKDRTIVRLKNRTPYQALIDVEEDITSLKLTYYLETLLPNIRRFCSLSDSEKNKILFALDKKQFELDCPT
ncbi:MAG: hypothetical protein HAW67_04595, partial [Endozoicomonadaceae bacterium]|nr:hypothetical protein [Endozoicomonadaceae bacterium]